MKEMVPNMEFGRRMAIEKELERTEPYNLCNVGKKILQSFHF